MNNKTFADVGFAAIALFLVPYTFNNLFEHKSHRDYRVKTSMT
jgi:hypothetical protein